jgi:hypothetical protein
MKRTLKFLVSSAVSTGSIALPLMALAQSNPNPFTTAQTNVSNVGNAAGVTTGGTTDLYTIIGNVINIILGFLGVLLLLYILYAGFLWMTAGGNEENIEKAQAYIKNAVIGLVIIILAFAISNFVLTQLLKATGQG